jgi:hypothetical protein
VWVDQSWDFEHNSSTGEKKEPLNGSLKGKWNG